MLSSRIIILASLFAATSAFCPSSQDRVSSSHLVATSTQTRQSFLTTIPTLLIGTTLVAAPIDAGARGRATLEYALDRYYPRLEAAGAFYANDLKRAIEKNDWAAIKAATQEPPKRSKADKSKIDGGVAERAAQAGGFSASRVVGAADLWASSFSDNSISSKTKKMKEQSAIILEVIEGMNYAASVALGEVKPSGGFLGFGAKVPSQTELAKEMRELYVKGGNAWNQFIFLSNDDLPVQFKRLNYL